MTDDELETLIAQHIFGWERFISADHTQSHIPFLRDEVGIVYAWHDDRGVYRGLDLPPWSTDVSAAWQAADKLADDTGCQVDLTRVFPHIAARSGNGRYMAIVRGGDLAYDSPTLAAVAFADTPARALCLALLRVRRVAA